MKTYEDGLYEAWEAARNVVDCKVPFEFWNLASGQSNLEVFKHYSATGAIEKIKEYENRIKVGDEVKKGEIKGVVIDVGSPKTMSTVWWQDGIVSGWARNSLNKTGRHFPEIAEVLKQMQEGNE